MAPLQRGRSAVAPDDRSILASIPGVPAWGAVAIAVSFTLLGVLIDSQTGSGTDLTRVFTIAYAVGCGLAVLAVRRVAIFSALVQPPLILFLTVPAAYLYFADEAVSMKALLLAAIPLVKRFPLMLTVTLIVMAIGVFRLLTTKPNPVSDAARGARRTPAFH